MAMGPIIEAKRSHKGTGNEADLLTAAQEDFANLKGDLVYLQQQVHGLRARLHGELSVLALRIEDNERRTMNQTSLENHTGRAIDSPSSSARVHRKGP